MKFFGNGQVYLPKTGGFITFNNGIYETEDTSEIAILESGGFKYEGDLELKIDEKEKQINELKSEVSTLKQNSDPGAVEKMAVKIGKMESENKILQDRLSENERASDILREKAIELKFAKKREIQNWSLLELCEHFVTKLKSAKEE